MSINLSDLPKLTSDRTTYPAWRHSTQALFLILDLSNTIAPPPSPSTSPPTTPTPSIPRPNAFLTASQSLQLAAISPTTSPTKSLTPSERDEVDQDEADQEEAEEWHSEQRRRDDKAVGWMFLTMDPHFAGVVLRAMCPGIKWDVEDGGLPEAKDMPMGKVVARDLWMHLEKCST